MWKTAVKTGRYWVVKYCYDTKEDVAFEGLIKQPRVGVHNIV